MASSSQEVYCTLLMSDEYLPGAMVLARSLKDSGTKKKLAALVTTNSLRVSTLDELKKTYDYILPVNPIVNKSPANLYLMNRPDLASTFTKIALWRQTRFRKIVYVDADMIALRAPDELFDQTADFAAVPDIGWPDCFNSGLLVLTPNMGDYYSLLALASRGISFDGADQGLLNMHFRNWHRLSFTYNCTPSGNYQYVPAYRHFGSSISMIHYIGTDKPWRVGKDWQGATGVYEELLGPWWAVYDKYYHRPTAAFMFGQAQPSPRTVQQYVKEEQSVFKFEHSSVPEPSGEPETPVDTTEIPLSEKTEPAEASSQGEVRPIPTAETRRYYVNWDSVHHAPPRNSSPEASDLSTNLYDMTSDPKLFQPPSSYPPPPKNLGYELPERDTSIKHTFPWEEKHAKPTRVFPEVRPRSPKSTVANPIDTSNQAVNAGSATPTVQVTPSEPFATFSQTNAWDEIPEIQRYIANQPQYRRRAQQIQVLLNKTNTSLTESDSALSPSAKGPSTDAQQRRPSLVLTDFPTEFERPSLPVTPAPVHRWSFWGQERGAAGDLPQAEGVPEQSQWDPTTKLLELQKRQSEILSAGLTSPKGNIPDRSVPKSSVPLPSEDAEASPVRMAPSHLPNQVEEPQAAQSVSPQPRAPEVEGTKTEQLKTPEPELVEEAEAS
ncbi:MAG: hypothetical protein Q9184_003140 [Pyrenodesmia sp. 2 TL-2023]